MHTASHLSSDPSKLSTAAQTAAVRRKCYAEELLHLLLHDRYMFEYVRESWIKSVKITFPHASSRASAAHGELNVERFPRCRPPSSRHSLSQFEKVAAVVPCPTWGQSSRSQCQFGLITKMLPLLPTEKAALLSDTRALAERKALQTNFGWWQETWLKASWQRRAISISMPRESSENATQANGNR